MARKYSQKEMDFIMDNYKTMSNQEIGKVLNLSRDAIRSKLRRLGLKKSSEDIKRNYQENKKKCGFQKEKHPLYGKHRSEELKNKLRKMYLGKTWAELHGNEKAKEMKNKATLNMSKDKNPSWIDGRSYIPYDLDFNKQFKLAIKLRDGLLCIKCGMLEEDHKRLYKCGLHVHHINYNKHLTIKENCCTLCNRCNSQVNFNRTSWIKFFQSMMSERYDYQYDKEGTIIINSYIQSEKGE